MKRFQEPARTLTIFCCVSISLGLGIATEAIAVPVHIGWASRLDSSMNVINPQNVLDAPDGVGTAFANPVSQPEAAYSGFGSGDLSWFGSGDLASFLGLSEDEVRKIDFLTLEQNGTANRPYESSTWTFDDGAHAAQVVYDSSGPVPAEIMRGTGISNADYASFLAISPPGGADSAYLAFDLDGLGLNLRSPDFRVTLTAPGTSGAAPDPDVMGRVIVVPEPVTVTLGLMGLGALISVATWRRAA